MNKDLFNLWLIKQGNNSNKKLVNLFNLNFGPQHPASHGVLRLILQLNGEIIEQSDTHIGLLHRGTEKLIEGKNFLKNLPYFDRMDYIAVLTQEHVYCLAVERLLETPKYKLEFTQVRIIFDELTRISNHIFCIATQALDLGTMSPIFWGFEEREKIMEIYERVSGARMHVAFYRPNDLSLNYITTTLLTDILILVKSIFKRISLIENKLLMTSIWKYRLSNIGLISLKQATQWGLTGVLARGSGITRDIRFNFNESYSNYYFLNSRSFIGTNGDAYDRYLIRIKEIYESLHLIIQVIQKWKVSNLNNSFLKPLSMFAQIKTNSIKPLRKSTQLSWYLSMEELISHFKYYSEGEVIKKNFTYAKVESPKGEYGVYLFTDGSNKPFRCRIRTPSHYHIQILDTIIQGHFFSDLISLIGSVDLVMGEVDR